MFNKGGFNTTFFNRAATLSVPFQVAMPGSGNMALNLYSLNNLQGTLSGRGDIACGLEIITPLQIEILRGSGDLALTYLVYFFVPLTINMPGNGNMTCDMIIQTPLEEIEFSGSSGFSVKEDIINQLMAMEFRSTGSLTAEINLQTSLGISSFTGNSAFFNQEVILTLALALMLTGDSGFKLRRIGAIDKDIFELENIKLLPGQTVTIDTDLLTVKFDGLPDVSAVTSDSIFFQLFPGDTTFIIENSPGEKMEVNVVTQNRWL